MCVYVHQCVCVREREREREQISNGDTGVQTLGRGGTVSACKHVTLVALMTKPNSHQVAATSRPDSASGVSPPPVLVRW